MGVIIREISTGEVVDIPLNFALEDAITCAYFTTDGSRAIPVTLPMTDRNTRISGYANRADRLKKVNTGIKVIIQKGSYIRRGTLFFEESDPDESTYSATIVYNESDMYKQQSELKLHELPNLPIIQKSTDELIAMMQNHFITDDLDKELTVFRIYLKNEGSFKKKYEDSELEYTITANFPLNDFDSDGFNSATLKVKDKFDIVHDDQLLTIPSLKGIGISPFVRGWYIIDLIAKHYGYRVGENPFKTHYQLRRLTFLNNTADAIVADRLYYKDLMPDITITEFFQFLWARFGAKAFIDGNTDTLHIKLLKKSLTNTDANLLSISGKIHTTFASPKQLKLSAAKNLEGSNTETDTYEEFLSRYNNTIGDMTLDFNVEGVGGVLYEANRGLYYLSPMSRVDTEGKQLDYPEPLSSIHFDWDKKVEGLEYEDITSPDECITMFSASGKFGPHYAQSFALYNSVMEIDKEMQNRSEPNKLVACWDMGHPYMGDGIEERVEYPYKVGSIFPYIEIGRNGAPSRKFIDREGNTFHYALTWIGKEGCFENFWKEYDAILRHSNDEISGKLNLPSYQLASLDISQKYVVNNQIILLKDYKYITGSIDVDKQEFTGYTLGLYEPYDLEKEQSHPTATPILYYWKLTTTKEKILEDERLRLEDKYQKAPEGTPEGWYEFESCVIKPNSVEDPTPPKYDGLAYLPPTLEEVESNVKRGQDTHPLKAVYVATYRIKVDPNTPGGLPEWVKKTEEVKYEGEYNSWFFAAKRYS